ncbi:MAG TPA: hypothetical protein VHU83_11705 [Bryobacteraceae bacterium]|jgi:hypothetical protein|nr:hypothetical protein [Bryobacteraceae bacterium]
MLWERQELVASALAVIKRRIDYGKRYRRELANLRGIERRLGFSGVTEEVEQLATQYQEARNRAASKLARFVSGSGKEGPRD